MASSISGPLVRIGKHQGWWCGLSQYQGIAEVCNDSGIRRNKTVLTPIAPHEIVLQNMRVLIGVTSGLAWPAYLSPGNVVHSLTCAYLKVNRLNGLRGAIMSSVDQSQDLYVTMKSIRKSRFECTNIRPALAVMTLLFFRHCIFCVYDLGLKINGDRFDGDAD